MYVAQERQVPIGDYVVDFARLEQKLMIEVDSGRHAAARDQARSNSLEERGFRSLRFWNNEVLQNTPIVLEAIVAAISPTDPSPDAPLRGAPPSPEDGEGKQA